MSILCNTVQIFFSSISKQNSPNIGRKYRTNSNFLKMWRCQFMKMRSELIRHSEIKDFSVTSWPDVYFRKTLYFFSFSPKYNYKNKQGIFLHNYFKIFLRVFSLGSVVDVAKKKPTFGQFCTIYCIENKMTLLNKKYWKM